VIDSWGSIPAGILKGHFKDLGHYDECVAIEQTVASGSTVVGKYCLANLPLTDSYGIGKSKSLSAVAEAFYISLSRIAWPLGLSWVVFASMQGYRGLANSFLASPLWQPLYKVVL